MGNVLEEVRVLGDGLDVLDDLLEGGKLRLGVRDVLLGLGEVGLEAVDSGDKLPLPLDGVVVLPGQKVNVVLRLSRSKARSEPVLPAGERQEKRGEDLRS